MSFSMNIPDSPAPAVKELDAAERAKRATSAQAVVADAPFQTKQAEPRAPKAVPSKVAASGVRPWEVVGATGVGTKQRLSLNLSMPLRAKLEYLEGVLGRSKSDIACAGIYAECLRVAQQHELLMPEEVALVRARTHDNKASSLDGTSRMVLMITPDLMQRMQMLKELRLIGAMSEVAVSGIEDECNFQLKKRGEL